MYQITVKGKASTDYAHPEQLDGIDCQEEFTAYFGDEQGALKDKGVTSGYLSFEFEDGVLWSVTTYHSPVKLTPDELHILEEYTQGQWSDGIGEGFEQEPCMLGTNNEECYISAWDMGQEITTTQGLI